MGQRSQIYVRYIPYEEKGKRRPKRAIAASYFQWNFGERMVSRARYTMEWIKEHRAYMWSDTIENMKRIMEVNFNYKDLVRSHDVVKEFEELAGPNDSLNDWLVNQDNNDGILLIDIRGNRLRYAFIGYDFERTREVYDAEGYMNWDYSSSGLRNWRDVPSLAKDVGYTQRNISRISRMAKLMTPEQVDEFLSYDYAKAMEIVPKKTSMSNA